MYWRPKAPGEWPTLGWIALGWMMDNLAMPDRGDYEPFIPTTEQAQFILNFYRLDHNSGKRRYRRGVISRAKGWGKSPFLAAIACFEALGPAVPAGWDDDGRPMGIPWSNIRTPYVQLAAVSEDQTRNAWSPLLEMLRMGPIMDRVRGLEPLESFVNLPRGRIEFSTSAATSKEGQRPIFSVLDQTEEWKPSNGGVKLAATIRRNLGKTGGASIESPNAFEPGAGSVAEDSAVYAAKIAEGKARDDGLYYDHREAPADTDMHDRDSLLKSLEYVYGDSHWVDLERIVAEIWDPATDPQDARRFYLNQITHAPDSWLSQPEWRGCLDESKQLVDGDIITLGFDGSKSRKRGVADATALVACRVSDGHTELIRAWEQPDGARGVDWEVPATEVDAQVRDCFKRFKVIGFYADPAKWESWIAAWEAAFHHKLRLKASPKHPIEWWINNGRSATVAKSVQSFHTAVLEKQLTHDGGAVLTRHILNARREPRTQGVWIRKDHPDSSRKIDAAWAAVLAWQARLDAVAAGHSRPAAPIPRRIR